MTHRTTLERHEPLDQLADARFEARAVIEAHLRRTVPHIDVGDLDPYLPLRDEADLDDDARAALLHAIEDAAGVRLRADLVGGDASLDDLTHALAVSTLVDRWHITISFDETARFDTTATAVLTAGLDEIEATGAARKHPADPNVVDVGHEVAAARALLALAHQLLAVATTRISEWDDDATPLTS